MIVNIWLYIYSLTTYKCVRGLQCTYSHFISYIYIYLSLIVLYNTHNYFLLTYYNSDGNHFIFLSILFLFLFLFLVLLHSYQYH